MPTDQIWLDPAFGAEITRIYSHRNESKACKTAVGCGVLDWPSGKAPTRVLTMASVPMIAYACTFCVVVPPLGVLDLVQRANATRTKVKTGTSRKSAGATVLSTTEVAAAGKLGDVEGSEADMGRSTKDRTKKRDQKIKRGS